MYFEGHGPGGRRRKNPQALITRKVATAAHHLLALQWHTPAQQTDSRTDAPGVWSQTTQPHRDPRRRADVFMDLSGSLQPVHHQIEVAILIQIGQGHTMPNGRHGQSPGPRHVLEGQITAIAEHGHRRLQTRKAAQVFHGIARGIPTIGSTHCPQEVGIEDVMVIARAHDEVLEPVQIDIHEDGAPRPIRGADSGHLGDLRVSAIAATHKEGVARHLRSKRGIMRRPIEGGEVIGTLALTGGRIGREHVHHHEVIDAIPVDVGEIHTHGRHGNLPDGLGQN